MNIVRQCEYLNRVSRTVTLTKETTLAGCRLIMTEHQDIRCCLDYLGGELDPCGSNDLRLTET